MTKDSESARTAENLLLVRSMRTEAFPSEIFDEHAWTMLLRLFIAHAKGEHLSEAELIALSETPLGIGQRWLAHLVDDAQVEPYSNGGALALTRPALDRMQKFLRMASRVHATDGPG